MADAVTESTIDWPGKSRKAYRYWVHKIGTPMQAKGGNYIFAKETEPGRFHPIYIEQTGDLDLRFDQHHKASCITRAGATHIHTHLNSDEKSRLAEEADLIDNWNPKCNG